MSDIKYALKKKSVSVPATNPTATLTFSRPWIPYNYSTLSTGSSRNFPTSVSYLKIKSIDGSFPYDEIQILNSTYGLAYVPGIDISVLEIPAGVYEITFNASYGQRGAPPANVSFFYLETP